MGSHPSEASMTGLPSSLRGSDSSQGSVEEAQEVLTVPAQSPPAPIPCPSQKRDIL